MNNPTYTAALKEYKATHATFSQEAFEEWLGIMRNCGHYWSHAQCN